MLNNKERFIVTLLSELAEPLGIQVELFCLNWVIRLRKGEQTRFVMGYTFDLNSAASRNICADKVATSDLLRADGIPSVDHQLFLRPELWQYVDSQGNWKTLQKILGDHGRIVLKPNEGSGGKGVALITSERELETVVQELFTTERAIAVSRFHDIRREVRFLILDGDVQLAYAKTRRTLIGDGKSTVLQLLMTSAKSEADSLRMLKLLRNLETHEDTELMRVPRKDEIALPNWKHNLGGGGIGQKVNEPELSAIAVRAAASVGLRFGAVDIVETEEGPLVLEVNSGAMIEHYIREDPGSTRRDEAKAIYSNALERMFTESR